MGFDDLTQILPCPDKAVNAPKESPSWGAVEQQLGFSLPGDYKRFISVYGDGCIDRFLWILNPLSTNQYLNLLVYSPRLLEAAQQLAEDYPEEIEFSSEILSGQLIPWAVTDNGDALYWKRDEGHITDQVYVSDSGGLQWNVFPYGTSEFLVLLLSAQISVEFFPENFPFSSHTFSLDRS